MPTVFPKGNDALPLASEDWDGTEEGIETATWIPLDGLGEYTRANTANVTDHHMYGRVQAVSTVGIPGRTVTLNGWYALGDPGQDLLRQYTPDGPNANQQLGFLYLLDVASGAGYAVMVNVGGGEERSNAEGGLQPVSFTLAPQTDPIAVEGFEVET